MRVALADDAIVLREGLARVLAETGIEVVAQVGTADELLTAIDQLGPDVAIVDIRMPPTWSDEGLAVAEEIRRRFPQVGVLLLSQYVEAEYALRLLEGGSERIGYLLKERMLDDGRRPHRPRHRRAALRHTEHGRDTHPSHHQQARSSRDVGGQSTRPRGPGVPALGLSRSNFVRATTAIPVATRGGFGGRSDQAMRWTTGKALENL